MKGAKLATGEERDAIAKDIKKRLAKFSQGVFGRERKAAGKSKSFL